MAWTERQTALLRAMGLRTWSAPVAAGASEAAPMPAIVQSPDPADLPVAPAVAPGVALATPSGLRPAADVSDGAPVAPAAAPALALVAAAFMSPAAAPASARDHAPPTAGPEWTALRAAVTGCTACALHAGRTQPVFGSAAAQADWMVVGDPPDEHDDAAGDPFAGPAGRLLDAMLRALGLARGDGAGKVHVVNAVRCRPPNGRNPTPDEIDTCRAHLQRQVELVQPRVLLAMGRFAIQALLRSDAALGTLRSRVHTAFGVPLVVTYHPGYLLRNPADKARAWDDLCLAASLAGVSPSSPGAASPAA